MTTILFESELGSATTFLRCRNYHVTCAKTPELKNLFYRISFNSNYNSSGFFGTATTAVLAGIE
jgi:hypothetical protein